MKSFKCLYTLKIALIIAAMGVGSTIYGQRIKPSSRIEKAPDSLNLLISDGTGKYQHTKLIADSGIDFILDETGLQIKTAGGLNGSGEFLRLAYWLNDSTLAPTNIFWNSQEFKLIEQTNSLTLPQGLTNQRDPLPDNGQIRYNTQRNKFEGYENGLWVDLVNDANSYTIYMEANGGSTSAIAASDTINFIAGTNVTLSKSGNNITISSSGGSGGTMSSFDIQEDGNTPETITDMETINFISGTGMDISRTGAALTFASTVQSGITSFDIQANGGAGETIGDGGSINFVAGTNMTISRTGSTLTFSSSGGGGGGTMSSFSVRANGGVEEEITDGEVVVFSQGPGMTISRNFSEFTFSSMDNWNFQVDGGSATSIGENETLNFAAGTNMTIGQSGNTLTFNSTGGSGGVTSLSTSAGLDNSPSTGNVNVSLDLSELGQLSTFDGADFLVGTTSTGTEARATFQSALDNTLFSSDGSVGISLSSSDRINLTASTSYDWNLQEDGNAAVSITDGATVNFISGTNMNITRTGNALTFNSTGGGGVAGVSTISTGTGLDNSPNDGDVNITLDLQELTFQAMDGDDFFAGHTAGGSTVKTTIQDFLNRTLTSSDGSVSIDLSGSTQIDLRATGGGGGSYTSWTARADDGVTDAIINNEVLDFAGGSGLSTSNDGTNITTSLAFTELFTDNTPSSSDFIPVVTAGGTHYRTQISSLAGGGFQFSIQEDAGASTQIDNGETIIFESGTNMDIDRIGNTLTFNATGGAAGMDNFNVQANGGTTTSITDNETINFAQGTNMSIVRSGNTFTFNSTATGGGGMDNFNIQAEGGASTSISDNETINFVGGSDMSVARVGNTLTFNSSALNNFNIQADGGATTSITDNETINFDAGTNMTILRSGNTLTFNSTATGGSGYDSWQLRADDGNTDFISDGEVVDFAGGTGIITTYDGVNLTNSLNPSEFTIDNTISSSDYLWTFTSGGTQRRTQISSIPFDVNYSWNLSANNLSPTAISNAETVSFNEGAGIDVSRVGNTITISATASAMDNFNIQVDGSSTTSITDNETINFASGTGMQILRSGNTLTFNNTSGGGGGVDAVTSGIGLDIIGSATNPEVIVDFSEFTQETLSGGSYLVGHNTAGAERRTTVRNAIANTLSSNDNSVQIFANPDNTVGLTVNPTFLPQFSKGTLTGQVTDANGRVSFPNTTGSADAVAMITIIGDPGVPVSPYVASITTTTVTIEFRNSSTNADYASSFINFQYLLVD